MTQTTRFAIGGEIVLADPFTDLRPYHVEVRRHADYFTVSTPCGGGGTDMMDTYPKTQRSLDRAIRRARRACERRNDRAVRVAAIAGPSVVT